VPMIEMDSEFDNRIKNSVSRILNLRFLQEIQEVVIGCLDVHGVKRSQESYHGLTLVVSIFRVDSTISKIFGLSSLGRC
jgi:RNA-binding protein YlmH